MISVAVALWKRKGTRRSLRDVVLFLTGARTYHLDWFYFRLVEGTGGELHLLPAPSSTPGTLYDNPETVTDVWLLDVTGTGVDLTLAQRWLEVMLASNERINPPPGAVHRGPAARRGAVGPRGRDRCRRLSR